MSVVTVLETIQTLTGGAALLLGLALFMLAAVGMVRFSDPFTRLTAVTKSGSLGICLVLLGVLVLEPSTATAITLAAAILLQLVTTPIGSVALSRGAFRSGAPMSPLRYAEGEAPEETDG